MPINFLTIAATSFIVLIHMSGVLASTAQQALKPCLDIDDSKQRLECYDRIAHHADSSPKVQYIRPSTQFLESKLVTKPWVVDMKLTVSDFVELISQAEYENGDKIQIKGWTKQNNINVLHIVMRSPVDLNFMPNDPVGELALSLLQGPIIKGSPVDAELFIFTIASMVPDKSAPNSK